MKKSLLLIAVVALVLSGCSNQHLTGETADVNGASAQVSEIEALIEQARWGDGQAFLKLADCYRDGKGVKKDFLNMVSMLSQAEKYGAIRRMDDYMKTMPADSEYKMLYDAMDLFEHDKKDEALAMSEQLVALGSPEGYSLKSIIAIESKDTLEGKRLMAQAVSQGSTFAELMQCMPEMQQSHRTTSDNIDRLRSLADRNPVACMMLAEIYTGHDDARLKDESLAAYYFLKADEQACLNKQGAQWLLSFKDKGGALQLSDRDIERLHVLAADQKRYDEDGEYIVVDTVAVDSIAIMEDDTEAVDTIDCSELFGEAPKIPLVPIVEMDKVVMDGPNERYAVVCKGGKCGMYDFSKFENVTRIEYDTLYMAFRKEIEGEYVTYFHASKDGNEGLLGIMEATNQFITIMLPRKEE